MCGAPYIAAMATLSYEIVDVFTDVPYAGNPLAVVLDADELDTGQLPALAREFNLSETAFPLRSERADYRLRIFTPSTELPFAGHPSVGAAHTLARLGRIPAGDVVQECGAGLLPVHVTADGARLTGGRPGLGEPLDPDHLLRAAGLGEHDLDPVAPPRTAGCGLDFAYLPVRADALARTIPDVAGLRGLAPATGLCVVHWAGSSARLRMFAADIGVSEDPATGSAALGLGVWLAGGGLLADGETAYRVRQGVEMGRPSTLDCVVTVEDGRAVGTTVAGSVVPVARGEIRVP